PQLTPSSNAMRMKLRGIFTRGRDANARAQPTQERSWHRGPRRDLPAPRGPRMERSSKELAFGREKTELRRSRGLTYAPCTTPSSDEPSQLRSELAARPWFTPWP